MATTYNFTNGSIHGQMRPHDVTLHENRVRVERNILDFSLQNLNAGDSDVGQAITIPAMTTVLNARVRVITAETASGTIDLGYGTNPDQWGDGIAVDTINTIVGGIDAPVYFAAADTIDVVATTDTADVDLTIGKIEVLAFMLKHIDDN